MLIAVARSRKEALTDANAQHQRNARTAGRGVSVRGALGVPNAWRAGPAFGATNERGARGPIESNAGPASAPRASPRTGTPRPAVRQSTESSAVRAAICFSSKHASCDSASISVLRSVAMFVIELIYNADLAEIDAHMKAHVAFLNKHYDAGRFLVSGRKIPRDGGIILALADSRSQIEAVMREIRSACMASPSFA